MLPELLDRLAELGHARAGEASGAHDAHGPPCPSCHKPADPGNASSPATTAADDRDTKVVLADATLLDQHSRPVRFADEVGDGRVTVSERRSTISCMDVA